jgi:hypothetical protein
MFRSIAVLVTTPQWKAAFPEAATPRVIAAMVDPGLKTLS